MSDSASKNKALMRRVYEEMWNRADPAAAAELFASPDGVERFVNQFLLSFPDLQLTVEGMLAEGDQVAVQFSAQATHSGEWLGFAATGRTIHYTGLTLARIGGDKIIGHQTWWDKAGLIEQIQGGQE
jgi:predicted ester cyclase